MLSIVVPSFNEPRLNANLDVLRAELGPEPYELIVVNDVRGQGKGAAVLAGLRQAKGERVLFIDGGMEIHPKEIRIFMRLMDIYCCDMVIGSKRHPQSVVAYPWYRRVLSLAFQLLVRLIFDVDVTDTQVGLKLISRPALDAVLPDVRLERYGFDLELLVLAKRAGFGNVLEAPVRLDYFNRARPMLLDLWHVGRVGASLVADVWRLWWPV